MFCLKISVEYYGFSLYNFQYEILHWFKPMFNSGKLRFGVQRLVKNLPEIKPEYIEVDVIPKILPFEYDNGDILACCKSVV